jgi:hypothetical protein
MVLHETRRFPGVVSGNPLLSVDAPLQSTTVTDNVEHPFLRGLIPPSRTARPFDAVHGTHDHIVLLIARIADSAVRDRPRKIHQVEEMAGGGGRASPCLEVCPGGHQCSSGTIRVSGHAVDAGGAGAGRGQRIGITARTYYTRTRGGVVEVKAFVVTSEDTRYVAMRNPRVPWAKDLLVSDEASRVNVERLKPRGRYKWSEWSVGSLDSTTPSPTASSSLDGRQVHARGYISQSPPRTML